MEDGYFDMQNKPYLKGNSVRGAWASLNSGLFQAKVDHLKL
jgi:hypothetical protein